jgi:EAL and modified HD-GYP domain-containing signal transduction protein
LSALRGKGYRIAVEADAFDLVDGLAPEQVDLIKVDMRRGDAAQLKARFDGRGPRLMATFIEDQPALSAAREIGFDWYQGFVFAPPFQVRFSKRKRFSNRGVELQILAELASTEMDIDRLESALAQHPDLCVLLLKQVNTAAYARPERRVDSLRQAIVILGQERIKALAAILLLSQNDEIKEIQIRTLLIRAAMARRVAGRIRSMEPALAFTLGLFSRLDALEQMPMVEILDGIPFSSEVREVLLARAGEMGRLLDLLDAYERGEVSQLNPSVVATLNDDFVHAAAWAEKWLVKPA